MPNIYVILMVPKL